MFLHTWTPHPDILTIGGFHLRWYGLCLALAALAAVLIIIILAKRYRLNVSRMIDLTLLMLVTGFIGARLYHISNEWSYYRLHPDDMVRIWNGGLAIHGGIIVGLIVLIVAARRWRLNPWLLADIAAPALAIGQAIGRWGNYFNQELFGRPTGLPWGIPITFPNRPAPYFSDTYFHPTFLYESLGHLLIAGLLWWLHARRWRGTTDQPRVRSAGAIALTYLILSPLLRVGIETLRIDTTPIIGGIRLPIIVASLIAAAALAILIIRLRRAYVRT